MRGYESIKRLRLNGYRPDYVWLFLLCGPTPKTTYMDAEHSLQISSMPEIHIGSDENIATLDFRALVGVTVLLFGNDLSRLRAAYRRLMYFSPKRVIKANTNFFYDTGEINE